MIYNIYHIHNFILQLLYTRYIF